MNEKMSACLPNLPMLRLLGATCVAVASMALVCPPAHAATAEGAPVLIASHPSSNDAAPAAAHPKPLADFRGTPAGRDVREVANWAFHTGDNHGRAVVILDKREATVYAFDPHGRLVASAPALLGLTVGDGTAPGVADKPLSQVGMDERTTPAGRFIAEPGFDDTGVDVVWVDYDAAVAMHRVITTFPEQHRPERLASPYAKDRRISYGCINLPIPFYEKVISPTVHSTGAVIYVLPETKPPSEVFGSWDVTDPAAHPPAAVAKHSATPAADTMRPVHLPAPQVVRTSGSAAGL